MLATSTKQGVENIGVNPGWCEMSSKKKKLKELKRKLAEIKRLARKLSMRDGAYDGRYRPKRFEDKKKKKNKRACRKFRHKEE